MAANKGTAALDASAIAAVFNAMTSQVDADGNPILISKFHIVVPPAKYLDALKAVAPDALIASGLSSTSAAAFATSVENYGLPRIGRVDVRLEDGERLHPSRHPNAVWAQWKNGAQRRRTCA